jgi:hypothetical protein
MCGDHFVDGRITSRVGDGDLSDEWSKGRSSASIQVTSPTGNFDPYRPALPTGKFNKPSEAFMEDRNTQIIPFQAQETNNNGTLSPSNYSLLDMQVLATTDDILIAYKLVEHSDHWAIQDKGNKMAHFKGKPQTHSKLSMRYNVYQMKERVSNIYIQIM